MHLELNVNGTVRDLNVDARHDLLGVLRDQLRLTGTKRGCDDGACGTCVVNVDGAMARACRVPVARVQGASVTTIEALAEAGPLHPLQEAFIDADAVQCGFCTPGMIMAAKALLDRNPAPTRAQIAKALGSNLCRCTGYLGILDAVERAAAVLRGDVMSPTPAHTNRRADARAKVLGGALYAADLVMPGMVHGAVLRSPHAHAEVAHIDDSAARALAGVLVVVTAHDVPGKNLYGRAIKDQRVLCDGRVRQVGDAIAAVAATSREIAEHALSLIRVQYRLLPVVADPEDAVKDGAPLVHAGGNVLAQKEARWGDPENALARSDVVVEHEYTTPFVEHAYLEPESALAYRDESGRLVVRSATQHSHLHRRIVAETMGLAPEQVRVVPTVVGGAFGAKTDVSCECVAALLVLKTGRPVKIVYSRAESFASTTKRHPFRMRCRTGATRDGRVTALVADVIADTGAYASAGPGIMVRAFVSLAGPYHFAHAALRGRVVYTNNTTAGAMRGYGACQVAFAIESQMDLLAAKLGIDPLEFRLMNRRLSPAAVATPQDREQEAAYHATLEAVRPHYEAAVRARRAHANGDGRVLRGVGIASMRYGIGYSGWQPPESTVQLQSDGRVELTIGSIDMGQGTDTALALIAARELALPVDAITVVSGDTDRVPDNGASSGSRVIYTDGNAVKDAAGQLRDAILSTASELLKQSYESLELADGRVASRRDAATSRPAVSLADVARARVAAELPLRFTGHFHAARMRDSLSGEESAYLVHVSATHVAEVEIDTRRGTVRVLRVIAAHDVGRAIFPEALKGQIEGAVSMGMGFALKEEFYPGVTTGFEQYRIPTARDMPEVVTLLVEKGDPSAGLGAKGAAECATVAVAPAILNAIADALGARVYQLPATPARIVSLISSNPGVTANA